MAAIEVIGIDDGKRFVDHILRNQDCVICPPRFRAIGVYHKARREHIKLLEAILNLDLVFESFSRKYLAKVRFKVFANDKYDLAKASPNRVKNRIVHDRFARWPDAIHLLETTVATAHPGSKYKKRRSIVHERQKRLLHCCVRHKWPNNFNSGMPRDCPPEKQVWFALAVSLMPFFNNGESETYYRDIGSGKTIIVLVHGWYQTGAQAWGALIPALRGKFRLVIPDLPGHGHSRQMPVRFSIESNVHLIESLVASLRRTGKASKIILVGHSYGSYVALSVAARQCPNIDAYVVMAAVDDYRPYNSRLKWALRIPRWLEGAYYRLQALLGSFPYGDRKMLYESMAPDLYPGPLEYAQFKNRVLSLANSRIYMKSFLDSKIAWPAAEIIAPVLFVCGERDYLTPPEQSAKIAGKLRNAKVEIIPNTGHNVQITGAKVVASLLRAFVEKPFRPRRKK